MPLLQSTFHFLLPWGRWGPSARASSLSHRRCPCCLEPILPPRSPLSGLVPRRAWFRKASQSAFSCPRCAQDTA